MSNLLLDISIYVNFISANKYREWYLCGVIRFRLYLSAVVLMELYAGAHGRSDIKLIDTISHSRMLPKPPGWMNFTSGAHATAIAEVGNYLWVGGRRFTRLNKTIDEMFFYNKANTLLPDNTARCVRRSGSHFAMPGNVVQHQVIIQLRTQWRNDGSANN